MGTVVGGGSQQLTCVPRRYVCFSEGNRRSRSGWSREGNEEKSGSTLEEDGGSSEQRIGVILNILFFPFNISTLTGAAVYSAFTKLNSGGFSRIFANLMCEHTQKVIGLYLGSIFLK